jgi:hypothetical protein
MLPTLIYNSLTLLLTIAIKISSLSLGTPLPVIFRLRVEPYFKYGNTSADSALVELHRDGGHTFDT